MISNVVSGVIPAPITLQSNPSTHTLMNPLGAAAPNLSKTYNILMQNIPTAFAKAV